MKFETVRIYFFSEFSVCSHPKILEPRDVTTSLSSRLNLVPRAFRIFGQQGLTKKPEEYGYEIADSGILILFHWEGHSTALHHDNRNSSWQHLFPVFE